MLLSNVYKHTVFVWLFWATAYVAFAQTTTITYTASTQNIANPERGFYRYTDSYASAPTSLTISELNTIRATTGQTLVFMYFICFYQFPYQRRLSHCPSERF
ncbi:hypothetical protein C7N43_19720 [Sphingobacteriales bacterium UPWRP_1]|nr:hypothetical protein B6N25_12950 [Sphingobacteriales bacterium TSM_CSS]PSJ75269.1 hypothetical protein C7N43_19720 [Sphingobacteriales bacterium UPWRP_1]